MSDVMSWPFESTKNSAFAGRYRNSVRYENSKEITENEIDVLLGVLADNRARQKYGNTLDKAIKSISEGNENQVEIDSWRDFVKFATMIFKFRKPEEKSLLRNFLAEFNPLTLLRMKSILCKNNFAKELFSEIESAQQK